MSTFTFVIFSFYCSYQLLKHPEKLAQLFSFLPPSLASILPTFGKLQVDQETCTRTVNLAHSLLLPTVFPGGIEEADYGPGGFFR